VRKVEHAVLVLFGLPRSPRSPLHKHVHLGSQVKRVEDYGVFVEFQAGGKAFTGLLPSDEAKVSHTLGSLCVVQQPDGESASGKGRVRRI